MKALGFTLLLGSLAPLVAGAEVVRERSRKSLDPAGLAEVVVRNARGEVDVRRSPDRSLHITALKVARGPDRSSAQDLARQARVELTREGDRYIVQVRYPQGRKVHVDVWKGMRDTTFPTVDLNVMIELPPGLDLAVDGSRVDVTTWSLAGAQRITTSSGDVAVASAAGPVDVSTASGTVRLDDVGRANVRTGSGDIRVERAADSLTVLTSSGDIEVRGAALGVDARATSGDLQLLEVARRVRARTGSGELHLGLVAPFHEANLQATSGDIRLGLAEELACRLDLRTSSGNIEVDVPCQTETVTRQLVTATVRQGKAPVAIRTQSGGITVLRGEP